MPRLARRVVRTVGRTAVVAGTAAVTVGAVNRAMDGGESSPVPPTSPAAAPSGADDRVSQLQELAKLRDNGVLTDAEFESEKQRLLSS
jgi:hypothetical protein